MSAGMSHPRMLVTQSLISSWLYYTGLDESGYHDDEDKADERTGEITPGARSAAQKCEEAQDKALAEFVAALRREKQPQSEAMLRGIRFEALVARLDEEPGYAPPDKEGARWRAAAAEIADIVRGGAWQVKAKRESLAGGVPVLLYGKIDVLKAGAIYDVKFTSRYEAGKWYPSPQHPLYLSLIPEAEAFEYLGSNGGKVYRERYTRADSPPIELIVGQLYGWLRLHGYWGLYLERWKAL